MCRWLAEVCAQVTGLEMVGAGQALDIGIDGVIPMRPGPRWQQAKPLDAVDLAGRGHLCLPWPRPALLSAA